MGVLGIAASRYCEQPEHCAENSRKPNQSCEQSFVTHFTWLRWENENTTDPPVNRSPDGKGRRRRHLCHLKRLETKLQFRGIVPRPRPDREGWKAPGRIDFHADLAPRAVFGCIRRPITQQVLIFEFERDPRANVLELIDRIREKCAAAGGFHQISDSHLALETID